MLASQLSLWKQQWGDAGKPWPLHLTLELYHGGHELKETSDVDPDERVSTSVRISLWNNTNVTELTRRVVLSIKQQLQKQRSQAL